MFQTTEQQKWFDVSLSSSVKSPKQLEEETAFLKALFEKVDLNSEGSLSTEDLRKALDAEGKEELTKALGKNFFYSYTGMAWNSEGKVTFAEFARWVSHVQIAADTDHSAMLVRGYLQKLYQNMDRDRSNNLSLAELTTELQNSDRREMDVTLGLSFHENLELYLKTMTSEDGKKVLSFAQFIDWVEHMLRGQMEQA